MAFKMKGFPTHNGTAGHSALKQDVYKETGRMRRRREKSAEADRVVGNLEKRLARFEEAYGENPTSAQKDRLANLRYELSQAQGKADKRSSKYEKTKQKQASKGGQYTADPEINVDPTDPTKSASDQLASNTDIDESWMEEEYDTAPENKIEEIPDILTENEEPGETEEERKARLSEEAKKAIEAQQQKNTKGKTVGGGKSKTKYIKHGGHDTRPTYNFS